MKLLSKKFLLFFLYQSFAFCLAHGTVKTAPAKNINAIVIKIPSLNLKIKSSNSPFYTLKWKDELDMQIEDKTLIIKSKEFSSKKAWSNETKGQIQNLEIYGPSNNLQIFSFLSNISISKWTKSVFISSFKGQIKSNNTKGPWQISLKEGVINMRSHNNHLKAKALKGTFILSSSKGDFDLQWNEGNIIIKKSKGYVSFISDKSKIKLTRFTGDITGFSRLGAIQASVQANKVDVSSQQGAIKLYLINQGPQVKAYTETGKIYAPRYFYKKFSGKSTQVSGQIKSQVKKGIVLAKTEQGNIYIN